MLRLLATTAATAVLTSLLHGAEHRKEFTEPFGHPIISFWKSTTEARSYAKATAHDPKFDDAALWPPELSMDGEPAYRRQPWEPARMLVWARRDDKRSALKVNVLDPENWLEDGQPAFELPDEDTDVVFPDADEPYYVRNGGGDAITASLDVRHITVGSGAQVNLWGCDARGNWWIKRGGRIYERHGGRFSGNKHAFARNDNLPGFRPGLGTRPAAWTEEHCPLVQEISQYIHIQKPGATLEAVGNWTTQDQFHVDAGTFIVAPRSSVGTGGRATLVVHGEGILQLQSEASIAKRINQTFNWDVKIEGLLRAGSPERPIRKDVLLGLSAKDYVGEVADLSGYGDRIGLKLKGDDARIEVHRVDGSDARLRIEWHGIDLRVLRYPPKKPEDRGYDAWVLAMKGARTYPRTITLDLQASTKLAHVALDDIRFGGIQGVTPEQVAGWEDVVWGPHNQGPPEDLIAPCVWYDNLVARPGWPIVEIPAGKSLPVRLLTPIPQAAIHYTLDGSRPDLDSPVYKGSLSINTTTQVLARPFVADRPQGGTTRVACLSQDKPLPAVGSGGKRSGLKFVAGAWSGPKHGPIGLVDENKEKPAKLTGTVDVVTTKSAVKAIGNGAQGVDLDGFITVPRTGVYTFHLIADIHPRVDVYIDGVHVLHDDVRTAGNSHSIALAAGPHAIAVRLRRSWWGNEDCQLQWEGPNLAREPVPASALSH